MADQDLAGLASDAFVQDTFVSINNDTLYSRPVMRLCEAGPAVLDGSYALPPVQRHFR